MRFAPGVEVAPGVLRTEFGYGYFLEGKKDSLVAAGVDPSAFTDGAAACGELDGRPYTAKYRLSADDWVVKVDYVGAELEAQEQQYREQLSTWRAQEEGQRRRDDAGFQRFMSKVLDACL